MDILIKCLSIDLYSLKNYHLPFGKGCQSPLTPSPCAKIPFEHAILSIDGDDDDLFRQICDKPLENIHAGSQSVIINERLSLLFKKHLPIEILKKHHDHDQSSPAEKLKTKMAQNEYFIPLQ